MKMSPPLAVLGLIALSFVYMAWEYEPVYMAWEYEPVYHGHGYWICEADGLPADINGKPRQCPQFDGVNFNPVEYERKFKTICVDAENTAKEVPCSFPKARECVNLKGEAVYCHERNVVHPLPDSTETKK